MFDDWVLFGVCILPARLKRCSPRQNDLVGLGSGGEDITAVWQTIREELKKYDQDLLNKKEIIILTKTDLVDASSSKKAEKSAKKLCPVVFAVSILDEQSIKNFSDSLVKILREL